MRAILISTGDELTSGQTVDTNSAWLAKKLLEKAIPTVAHYTVGDSADEIALAIHAAAARVEIVLVTGGLGPTPDDLTRNALADVLGTELLLDEEQLSKIAAFFKHRDRPMAQANHVQAMIPQGASAITNSFGTAPGIVAEVGRALVVCMPGVPSEMRAMFDNSVTALLPAPERAVAVKVLRLYGIGESNLSERIGDILDDRGGEVVIGSTVSGGLISLTITATADSDSSAATLVEQAAAKLTERLGALIIGQGSDTLESIVIDLLRARKETAATAESCTGGMVSQMITAISGASECFTGGAVCYANSAKRDILGVPEKLLEECGAVSEPAAMEMARNARERFSSDWAISLTGIAGPGGGTEDKPVGLVWIALAGPNVNKAFSRVFGSRREQIRRRAAQAALNCLREALIAQG